MGDVPVPKITARRLKGSMMNLIDLVSLCEIEFHLHGEESNSSHSKPTQKVLFGTSRMKTTIKPPQNHHKPP